MQSLLCWCPLVSQVSPPFPPCRRRCLLQIAAASGLLRCRAVLGVPDLLFMAMFAAACCGMLLWRAAAPASFAAWRELPAAALRLTLAAPTPYKIVCHTLSGALPFSQGGGTAWDALLYLLALLFAGCGAAGTATVSSGAAEGNTKYMEQACAAMWQHRPGALYT